VYSERTQYVLIQERIGILDIEPPCTEHILAQYRGVCPQCDLDPVENLVAIPVPAPSFVHTLVEIPEEFVPPILQLSSAVPSTPSPEYVQALEDDPAHNGTPEYWADPEAGVNH
jgi:hypothetical protein